MEPVALSDIDSEFDDLVATSAAALCADSVCSTSRWILPAASAFAPHATPRVFRGEHGVVALLEHENPNGPVLTGFDPVWNFATPLIGSDPAALVREVFETLFPRLPLYAAAISGVVAGSDFRRELDRRRPVGSTATTERCVADLHGDFDAWLGRRSPRFRRSLRSAASRGAAAGVTVERHRPDRSSVGATFDRILDVERTSWKTDASSGLVGTDLGRFTRAMADRFAAAGDLRVVFARFEGRDIGYVIGGIVGGRYRGFQHSFDQDHADLAIGKLLQFHNIAALCDEGVQQYDMGMHMPYKESYTDRIEASDTLIFTNRQTPSGSATR